jgi:Mn-dependent DtxR family transcriptional regulator
MAGLRGTDEHPPLAPLCARARGVLIAIQNNGPGRLNIAAIADEVECARWGVEVALRNLALRGRINLVGGGGATLTDAGRAEVAEALRDAHYGDETGLELIASLAAARA